MILGGDILNTDKKKLINGIEVYKEDEDHVLIGNTILNQYIRLHTSNKECLEDLLMQYDGVNDRKTIDEYCKKHNIMINLDVLEHQMQIRGMFESDKDETRNEIESLGIKIFLFLFSEKPHEKLQKFCKVISVIVFFLFFSSLIYLFINFDLVTSFFDNELLKYRNSYSLGVVTTVICSYFILFMHEAAHVVVGYSEGLSLHKVGLYLYMGFIPQWFVSFRGIWKARRFSKIKIYCAGITLNFLIVLICCIISKFYSNTDLLKSISVGSLFMGINSLFPFSLTDGYFLFSALLKRDNLRHDMIVEMNNLLHFKFKREKLNVYFDTLINVFFYIIKLFFCYYWLFKLLLEYTEYAIILVGICAVIHTAILCKKVSELSKNWANY